jgi:potassium channel subfamily K
MLQTISFCLYLALGGGVFCEIENWGFADGLYWADYTLLTIGLGTDFPLTETLSRMLLVPYAAFGITLIGLVVSSVRGLVLERAKAKVVRRHLGKERERWKADIEERRRLALQREMSANSSETSQPPSIRQRLRFKKKEHTLKRLPQELQEHAKQPLETGEQHPLHRAEFELMRFIEVRSKNLERYRALGVSFLALLVVWVFGSVVFWICERVRCWSRFVV